MLFLVVTMTSIRDYIRLLPSPGTGLCAGINAGLLCAWLPYMLWIVNPF